MRDHIWLVDYLGFEKVGDIKRGSCKVYHVKSGDREGILKISREEWTFDHILRENEVLKRIKGVDGISQALMFYPHTLLPKIEVKQPEEDSFGFEFVEHRPVALLKEYIHGTECRPGVITGAKNQKVITSAVKAIHKEGIAGLELYDRNVIVTSYRRPYLIDLGFGKFKEEVTKREFAQLKKEDKKDLEKLLK